MVRHNLLISYRNFLRFKSSFFINLIGLSTGLACVLLIFIWVNDELKMDQFHEHNDRLYQVMENVDQGGGVITRESTSGPTADAMVADFPEVEAAVMSTLNWSGESVLSDGEHDIKAHGIYASAGFFKMFSFPIIQGQPQSSIGRQKIDRDFGIAGETIVWHNGERNGQDGRAGPSEAVPGLRRNSRHTVLLLSSL